jgi:iron complex outermembrane recepter protein
VKRLGLAASVSVLAAAAAVGPVLAQDSAAQAPASATVEEIVVTAQRREQSLRDVPISVSVFSEAFLEKSRIDTVDDVVAFTPGLGGVAVSTTTPRITVRGVGTEDFGVGSDPALGVYVDDVYLGRGVSSISDLLDVARVEVVKGPQGTLFGRNTTAGAISVTTNRPGPVFEARAEAALGEFEARELRGAVNLPLADRWALRLAGSSRSREGFVDNTLGGDLGDVSSRTGRLTLGFDHDRLEASLSAEHRRTRAEPGPYVNRVLVGTGPFGDVTSDLVDGGADEPRDDIEAARITLRLETSLGEGLRLTSVSAYNGFDNAYLEDTDASPLTLLHFGTDGEQDSWSQELRLVGESGRLDWFLGASAARDEARSTQFALYDEDAYCGLLFGSGCTDALGAPGDPRVKEASEAATENTSYALYGDATYALTDRLDVTAGLRIGHDRKRFSVRYPAAGNLLGPLIVAPPDAPALAALGELSPDGTLRQRYSDTSVQPRLALGYAFTPEIAGYLSATRGYKAGGFNQLSPGLAFAPETIWSYEAGVKGEALDGRLRFDLSAFVYEYEDLQVLINFAGSVITRNAAAATGRGVEVAATAAPVEGLTISANLAYLDAEYDAFRPEDGVDFSGNRLVRSPRFSGGFVADLERPLSARLKGLARLEASYRSRQSFDASNADFETQSGYALVGGSIGLALDDAYELRFFAQNLLDEDYLVDTAVVIPELIEYAQRGEPRSFGVRLLGRF